MCFSTQVSLDVLAWRGGFGDWKSNQLLLFIHLSSLVRIKVALQIVLQKGSYMWGKAVKWTQTIHDSDMKGYGRHHMSDKYLVTPLLGHQKTDEYMEDKKKCEPQAKTKVTKNADSLCVINFNEVKRHETMYIPISTHVCMLYLSLLLWVCWRLFCGLHDGRLRVLGRGRSRFLGVSRGRL